MIKRLFDLIFSAMGLVVVFPFLFIIAIFIKLADRGPVLFVQRRVGRSGRLFSMLKFRTMRVANGGASLTVGRDPRITRVGSFLRAKKLDELPQLWNVFIGQMSFVGPRPEIEKYVSMYSPAQRAILEIQPGVTDPASLALFDESELLASSSDPENFYIKEVMPEKIRINLEYAERAWLGSDILVIAATVLRTVGLSIDVFGLLKIKSTHLKVRA